MPIFSHTADFSTCVGIRSLRTLPRKVIFLAAKKKRRVRMRGGAAEHYAGRTGPFHSEQEQED
jgi:hypothetical protein